MFEKDKNCRKKCEGNEGRNSIMEGRGRGAKRRGGRKGEGEGMEGGVEGRERGRAAPILPIPVLDSDEGQGAIRQKGRAVSVKHKIIGPG